MGEQAHHPHKIGKKSVTIAIIGNAIVGSSKLTAFIFTGSAVMLSEFIHSVADTFNQLFLFIGIERSHKPADESFNYGYKNERFFWSLLSACGVFFIGAGVTVYHGFTTLFEPTASHFSGWTIGVLAVSALLEGFSLFMAIRELRKIAEGENIWKFVRHSGDPTLLAIIYEDSAAVVGVFIAAFSLIMVEVTGQPYWDSYGSILIGVLLGVVAVSLMNINREYLLGRAIPKHIRKKIYTILSNQPVVDEVHDFKTIMITTDGYRVKAEIEINGHYLAKKIFESRDFKVEYEDIHDYHDFIEFCTGFSDEVTRTLGKEIDLLEEKIEDEVPTVQHIDIETN